MAIMKKDVNFVFFVLIIATVVSFAGFTAYYQSSFKNISAEYNEKISKLQEVSTDLLEKKASLLQTTEALDETKTKVVQKEELYSDLRSERDLLQTERDTYKENYFQTKNELTTKSEELDAANVKITDRNRKIRSLEDDVAFIEKKKDECEDKLNV